MKIESLEIQDYPPIKNLKIDGLGNMVIIAGANGSGKTRLKEALVQALQGNPIMGLKIKATRDDEKAHFGNEFIEVKQGQQNPILNKYMHSRRFGRGQYVGSLVQVDSDRNIQTIKYNPVSWQIGDPDDQDTPSTFYYQNFTNRWQDFMDYIHKKVVVHDKKLLEALKNNPSMTYEEVLKKRPHPLEKYKDIFGQLLPGKTLQDINPANPNQFQYKDINSTPLQFGSLSSGEQEVVKIIFDIARKDIKDSVIIVDEPELHLHPTLAFKLVETLKSTGAHTNQFIFLTHSVDLISTYYSTGDVYFIDAEQTGTNQAHRLSELDHTHKELVKLMRDNLGLFAVGKKLVFIEGEDSSADRLIYHAIAQKLLPEAKIISAGSVTNIINLNSFEQQIRESIFGIDLYMIRDRDGLSLKQINSFEESGKIKCLPRRHIENYLLDPGILFKVAERLCLTTTNPELSEEFIKTTIKAIAGNTLKYALLQNTKEHLKLNYHFKIPTVKDLEQKTLNDIKNGILDGVANSLQELSDNLSKEMLGNWIDEEKTRLEKALEDETWVNTFPGKNVFSKVCGEILKQDKIRVRQAYVGIAIEQKPEIFDDIKVIFQSFAD